MWLNPSAQGVDFVASLHLLETCVQPECYTPASSQAGKFWSPKASLVMLSFSGPSVMQWWPLLAVSVNKSWKTRGPAPVSWKSGKDLGLIEEIEHATAGPEVVASLIGKQDWGLWWRRAKTDLSSSSTGLLKLNLGGCYHSAGVLSEWKDAMCDFSKASLSTQSYLGAAASYMCMHWAAGTCCHSVGTMLALVPLPLSEIVRWQV